MNLFTMLRLDHTSRIAPDRSVAMIPVHLTGHYGCEVNPGGLVRMHVVEAMVADTAMWIHIADILLRDGEPVDYWQLRRAVLMRRFGALGQWFRWTVAFEVRETWVADGFDMTDERAHDMLAHDLRYAYGHELKAEVLSRPARADVNAAQGYPRNRRREGWP